MGKDRSYNPHAVEREIYNLWESENTFHAEVDTSRKPYTIVIPPPNVTGALHLGHALNNTLQDILIRHKRMCGYNAMWLPGTDHAGIATQAVVEKRLKEEQNLTRHELGREGLVQKIWQWKEEYNRRILDQLRLMGCSCDWQRLRFTLDEVCAKAVRETFYRLFRDGLIYRGLRLVNWDTHLQTAVADDEVFHKTIRGSLWHIRYPLMGRDATAPDARVGEDYLVVATTRPETMLGDTAIAVHPDDARYKHLIGKQCLLPLVERAIPIIGDGWLVKSEFGTGCVKVTPGHDPNDYACGLRHKLPMINILTPDGRINENGGSYQGLPKEQARKRVVADLESRKLLEKIEPYQTDVGHSDRSKTPIEPLLSEQWFVKMDRLAEGALEAVRDGRVRIFPTRYTNTYLDWLGEKRDWCISRQLWWGHRIPVWRRTLELTEENAREQLRSTGVEQLIEGSWASGDQLTLRIVYPATGQTIEDPQNKLLAAIRETPGAYDFFVCLREESPEWVARLEQAGFEQDPDVLDTWFSSALWPHSTLGWPENNPDLRYFYPTHLLCTAREIITLWVARMVMTALYNTKQVPFQHVYIHPVIQDGEGRPMKKTLGNGVDPRYIIEQYGTDALRFTLAQLAGETQDIRIPVKRVRLEDGREVNTSERFELGRNFCNKLWQAATGFVFPNLENSRTQDLPPAALAMEDRWILSRLTHCVAEVDRRIARYEFNELVNTLYGFFWNDFCDWYLEWVKPRFFEGGAKGSGVPHDSESADVARQVLAWVLDQTLRLLHPVAPFITETLWRELNERAPQRGIDTVAPAETLLITARWPEAHPTWRDPEIEEQMTALQDVIRALRDIRTRVNVLRANEKEPSVRTLPRAVIRTTHELAEQLQHHLHSIRRLGQVEALEIGPDLEKPEHAASKVFARMEVFVPLAGLADPQAEQKRLQKERDEVADYLRRLEAKLANESFVAKAPSAVVERERERLAEGRQKLAAIEQNLTQITG